MHTKGEWKTYGRIIHAGQFNGGPDIALVIGGKPQEEHEANANLIAEAGTVANETGLTPRQLATQREDLLEACKKLLYNAELMDLTVGVPEAKAAIRKAVGE